jgi:hypothetical protein
MTAKKPVKKPKKDVKKTVDNIVENIYKDIIRGIHKDILDIKSCIMYLTEITLNKRLSYYQRIKLWISKKLSKP